MFFGRLHREILPRILDKYGTISVFSRSFSAFPDVPRSFPTVLLPYKVEVAIGFGITSWLGWVR